MTKPSDLRYRSWIQDFRAHGSCGVCRRQTVSERAGRSTRKEPQVPECPRDSKSQKPALQNYPNPKSADRGRDQVKKLGEMPQHLSPTIFPVWRELFYRTIVTRIFAFSQSQLPRQAPCKRILRDGQRLPFTLLLFLALCKNGAAGH